MKDADICRRAGYGEQLTKILDTIENAPYDPSQKFKRLSGDLKGYCSRRINYYNRVLYKVLPNIENARDDNGNLYDGIVRVYEAWGHRYQKPDLRHLP